MFRIPQVTKYLLLINIAVFLLTELFFGKTAQAAGIDANTIFGLHFFLAPDFHFYQLLTYMFVHAGWAHIFFNMFALWMFGCVVEATLGARRYIFFYLICGIGAGLFQEVAQLGEFIVACKEQIPGFQLSNLLTVAHSTPWLNLLTTVGASGAIYGILLAFGMLYPDQHIFIFPLPIPIKAKWFVIIYAAIELISSMSARGDGVAHVAHLGGMVIGYFLIRYWRQHPYGMGNYHTTHTFFTNARTSWGRHKNNSYDSNTMDAPHYKHAPSDDEQADWDYNAEQKAKQKEIDAILDKIRKSGYDSLTMEEKQKLFDSSNN